MSIYIKLIGRLVIVNLFDSARLNAQKQKMHVTNLNLKNVMGTIYIQ